MQVNVRLSKVEVERALASWIADHVAPAGAPRPKAGSTRVSFVTNDKASIAEFYMAPRPEGSDDLGYYVYVRNPQTFNPQFASRFGTQRPDFVVRRDGKTVAELYRVPQRGPS